MSGGRKGPHIGPDISVMTDDNLTLASSKTAWMRLDVLISRVNCFRVRVRSRSSWIGFGGTNLPGSGHARVSRQAK
jgi:hypothetical protein